MDLSIIVPCYNESSNLERLVMAFGEVIRPANNIELVLVDNGSRDQTPAMLQELLARPENRFARSVRVEVNQGYGYGILYGLRAAAGNYLAWTHADLQTPPVDVLRAYYAIQRMPDPENSLVRGLRRGRPVFDQAFTTAMGWVASWALRSKLYDVNAQPKLFHRSLLTQLIDAPHDFTLDLYLLHVANQLDLDVQVIEVNFGTRGGGEAKGGGSLRGKVRLCKRTMSQILKLRRELNSRVAGLTIRHATSKIGELTQARRAA